MTGERACDGCTLCCKVFAIPEFKKPMGVWCPHVVKGRGCGIYEERPYVCRATNCLWLANAEVPDYWKPDRSKMVLAGDAAGTLISVLVDAGYENNWKKPPFYGDLKAWAAQMRWRVQVLTPKHGWIIFPEEDLFLGERKADDTIVAFGYKQLPMTRQPAVTVRHGDGTLSEFVGAVYRNG